jgi:hypothetical protein
MISSAASQGVVSDEFATGNGLTSLTAPIILNLSPAGANLTSTGDVILWGYVCNPMTFLRRGRGTHAMVATLKRPIPARRTNDVRWWPPGTVRNRPMVLDSNLPKLQPLNLQLIAFSRNYFKLQKKVFAFCFDLFLAL